MRRIRRLFSALVLVSASWFIATPVLADQPSAQPPSAQQPATATTEKTERITTTATVANVDTQKRDLMLRSDDGTQFTVEVPQSVKLDRIHEGDRVKIDYYKAIGLALKKPQPGVPSRSDETTITEHKAGALPAGMVVHRITATVEVVGVDRTSNQVIVRRPSGAIDTIDVTDPVLQAQLANMHEGDRIQATYSEAVAIRVMQEGQPNQPNPPNSPNPPMY